MNVPSFKKVYMALNLPRTSFAYLLAKTSKMREFIFGDLERWDEQLLQFGRPFKAMEYLLCFHKEWRSLLAYRLKRDSYLRFFLFRMFFKPLESLCIGTKKIGKGLFIQHGFSTMIGAQEIGENCWINQLVNVGYSIGTGSPIIGDNVRISCGSIVLGDITIGDNSIIGAGAVVLKDVEPNTTVVGVPAHPIQKKE